MPLHFVVLAHIQVVSLFLPPPNRKRKSRKEIDLRMRALYNAAVQKQKKRSNKELVLATLGSLPTENHS